jgi:hypothetical protein
LLFHLFPDPRGQLFKVVSSARAAAKGSLKAKSIGGKENAERTLEDRDSPLNGSSVWKGTYSRGGTHHHFRAWLSSLKARLFPL